MSWNSSMESQHPNQPTPYNSIGSFDDFFGGFTYDHINYIFADAVNFQENAYFYPATNTSLYKFAVSESGSFSYYEHGNSHSVDSHVQAADHYRGQPGNPLVLDDDQATASTLHRRGISSSTSHAPPVECPRYHQDAWDNEVVWQDSIDPDNMTYEELLELREVVGTHCRGLSPDQIALLPTSKLKCGLFSRKKFRGERCVICQMDYKRGDKRIILPCKHMYHVDCGTRWLSINKACPICYKEVVIVASKH